MVIVAAVDPAGDSSAAPPPPAPCPAPAPAPPRIRGKTTRASRPLSVAERAQGVELADEVIPPLPLTRGECKGLPRPCPFVACKHHLYIDVNVAGGLRRNHPHLEVDEIPETCSLDVADRRPHTLEQVALAFNLARERVRQIEVEALAKLKALGVDEAALRAITNTERR
jgi:hypothetical protein